MTQDARPNITALWHEKLHVKSALLKKGWNCLTR
jgi:hypothetical protein